MAVFVVHHSALAALWDYDHPGYTAVHRFIDEEVRSNRSILISTALLPHEVIDAVGTAVAGHGMTADLVQQLYSDVTLTMESMRARAMLQLVPLDETLMKSAFHVAVSWDIPYRLAIVAMLAWLMEATLVVASIDEHRLYARLASHISGLEVRLIQ